MGSTPVRQAVRRRHRGQAVAVVIAFVLLVSGCSDSASVEADELRVAMPFPITGLDLIGPLSGDRAVLTINENLFDSLVRRDPDTGEFLPWLAESWETTDGTSWTFRLRDDVVFHDGTPLTSEDVKATVDALIASATPLSPIFSGVTGVQTPDDTTVVFTAERPLAALPSNVSVLGIAPSELVNEVDFNQNPVGSGKFKFESFQSGDELVLEANPDHWDGPPGVDRLVFKQIPEASNRVVALETGEIDVTWSIPPDQSGRLEQAEGITLEPVQAYLSYEILVNWDKPPLDNLAVRQALVHAIDAQAIVDNVLGGQAEPSTGPLPPTVFGSAELDPFGFDPELSRELLAEAGVENLSLRFLARDQEAEQQVALAMISNWADVGITVEPDFQELATWTETYVAQDFDLAIVVRPTLTGDADYTLGRLYLSSSNRIPCANAELDELIVRAGGTPEPADRQDAYDEALAYIWDNVCGIYPINVLEVYAWSDEVQGLQPSPSTIQSFAGVSLQR